MIARIKLFRLVLFTTVAIFTVTQAQEARPGQTLILAHPTVANLQRFQALITDRIFPLPGHFKIIGLYHHMEAYDYKKSEAYLKENPGPLRIELIGLDCELDLSRVYEKNNACAPVFRDFFEQAVGIIFPGGADLLPALYEAQQDLLSTPTDPHRGMWEVSFLFQMLGSSRVPDYPGLLTSKKDFMILGICLGMQTMNVATGGSLLQDIPSRLYGLQTVEEVLAMPVEQQHRNYHRDNYLDTDLSWYHFHPIQLTGPSVLQGLTGMPSATPNVLSSHHQCAEVLGKDLEVYATSLDGKVIEAVGHKRFPRVLGVQFHPELPELYHVDAVFRLATGNEGIIFHEAYPGPLGTDFHIAFWELIAQWLTTPDEDH